MLYGSVASLSSPSSNVEAWPYGTSLRYASLCCVYCFLPLLYFAVIDLYFILDVDVPLICALITAVYRILTFIEKRFDQRETTIGVQTRVHFKVSMLKIIAASSSYNSIEELQIKLRKQLRESSKAAIGD